MAKLKKQTLPLWSTRPDGMFASLTTLFFLIFLLEIQIHCFEHCLDKYEILKNFGLIYC